MNEIQQARQEPIQEDPPIYPDTDDPGMINGPGGWTGYAAALAATVAVALTLTALGYGNLWWGLIGALVSVGLIAAAWLLLTRNTKSNRREPGTDVSSDRHALPGRKA